MLSSLRTRVGNLLGQASSATLATDGPAGVQANIYACEAYGTRLYLLVPISSDHLLNLETGGTAVATTPAWHVRGAAHIIAPGEAPADLQLTRRPEARWSALVELRPTRVAALRQNGWGAVETIDLEA